MRLLKFVLPMVLFFGVAVTLRAADKEPAGEKAVDQTGSLTGSIHVPEKEAPRDAVASLHQAGVAGGEETIFFLFADGSVGRNLKDLAKKNATATVSGVITKEGYRVTSISNVIKSK